MTVLRCGWCVYILNLDTSKQIVYADYKGKNKDNIYQGTIYFLI